MSEKTEEWVEQTTEQEFWKPELQGEELVGVIVQIYDGQFGKQYTIRTEKEDAPDVVTPSHAVLQNRLLNVSSGDFVRIVFDGVGEAKKGQSAPKMYRVFKRG